MLIVLDGEVKPGEEIRRSRKLVAELSLANDLVISCTFISSRSFLTEKSPFLMNVRREGVLL